MCTVIKIQTQKEQYNPATMGGGGSFGEEFDLSWMSVAEEEEDDDKGSSASLPITMRRAGRGRRRRG